MVGFYEFENERQRYLDETLGTSDEEFSTNQETLADDKREQRSRMTPDEYLEDVYGKQNIEEWVTWHDKHVTKEGRIV